MTKRVLLSAALLLVGCPKSGAHVANGLSATKWEGWINVTTPCEDHGGYTGNDLRVCMVFGEPDGSLIGVDVDWDSQQLRPACDYFVFAGAADDETTTLMRFETADSDDRFRLTRSGDKLVGTFQVHPTCAEWPVEMSYIPLPPGFETRDPLQPQAQPLEEPLPTSEELPL